MHRKILYLFLTLLVAAMVVALAQSPTSSNPGGSETKDPYGATLDHPNPGSAQGATGQPYNKTNVNEGQTPATGTTTAAPSSSDTSSSTPATSSSSMSDTSGASSATTDNKALPRTASDLPLLATIGLLALGGALMVRSLARRNV